MVNIWFLLDFSNGLVICREVYASIFYFIRQLLRANTCFLLDTWSHLRHHAAPEESQSSTRRSEKSAVHPLPHIGVYRTGWYQCDWQERHSKPLPPRNHRQLCHLGLLAMDGSVLMTLLFELVTVIWTQSPVFS